MVTMKLATAGLISLAFMSAGCEKQVSFRGDVQPILAERCASCHSPGGMGYAASGFSVASYESLMKGTKYAEVIVPGSSLDSTLVRLIQHQADPSIAMPKSHQVGKPSEWLTREQIQVITAWIDQGAKNN
ncbi:MAG TPA: c-type cytochrome domain-containing protein [Burkholderiales bacterium]|nr:c-type cytochrome domain-containing protein [Burkholderiales bacterium]